MYFKCVQVTLILILECISLACSKRDVFPMSYRGDVYFLAIKPSICSGNSRKHVGIRSFEAIQKHEKTGLHCWFNLTLKGDMFSWYAQMREIKHADFVHGPLFLNWGRFNMFLRKLSRKFDSTTLDVKRSYLFEI